MLRGFSCLLREDASHQSTPYAGLMVAWRTRAQLFQASLPVCNVPDKILEAFNFLLYRSLYDYLRQIHHTAIIFFFRIQMSQDPITMGAQLNDRTLISQSTKCAFIYRVNDNPFLILLTSSLDPWSLQLLNRWETG